MASTTPPSTDDPDKGKDTWSVQSVLSTLNPPLDVTQTASSPLAFMHLIERLKTTPREGWRRFHIKKPESISDHMYRMSILTLLAPPSLSSRLNIPHCTRMALIHDMAESLVGDITPLDPSERHKHIRESSTMDFLCHKLLSPASGIDPGMGASIRDIYQEYEDAQTLEAKFVHDVDKMELLLQMVEYERSEGGELDLGEFVKAARKVELEEMWAWCEEVFQEREEMWRGWGKPLDEEWREAIRDKREKYFKEEAKRPLPKGWRKSYTKKDVNGA